MHKNNTIKEILSRMFEALESHGVSRGSPLAGFNMTNATGLPRYFADHWVKNPTQTRGQSKSAQGWGGGSALDHSPLLLTANSLYRRLSPEQQNMLRLNVAGGLSYSDIATRLNLSKYAVENIFRKKILPIFYVLV